MYFYLKTTENTVRVCGGVNFFPKQTIENYSLCSPASINPQKEDGEVQPLKRPAHDEFITLQERIWGVICLHWRRSNGEI